MTRRNQVTVRTVQLDLGIADPCSRPDPDETVGRDPNIPAGWWVGPVFVVSLVFWASIASLIVH